MSDFLDHLWNYLLKCIECFWQALSDFAWTVFNTIADWILGLLQIASVPAGFTSIMAKVNWFFPLEELSTLLVVFVTFCAVYWGSKLAYKTIVGLL